MGTIERILAKGPRRGNAWKVLIRGSLMLNGSAVKVGGRGRAIHFTLDDEVPVDELERGLREYLERSNGFFSGAKVSAEVGRRIVHQADMLKLKHVLEDDFHLEVSELRSTTESLEKGLTGVTGVSTAILPRREALYRERTLMVKGPCRSGTITHHEGDLVVLGDINPGARIAAAGNVIIFGALMGDAHAGVNGDEESVIAALSMESAQLRVGLHFNMVSKNGKRKKETGICPTVAHVRGGILVVEPFDGQFKNIWGWEVTQ